MLSRSVSFIHYYIAKLHFDEFVLKVGHIPPFSQKKVSFYTTFCP